MRHDNLRTTARNLALDRDSAIAAADLALIANDHINWFQAMATDRATYATSSSAGFLVSLGTFSSRITATNVLRVLSVTRETGSGTVDGAPIEIVSPADIYHARSLSTTGGTPRMVAFVRLAGTSNRLRAIVHPPSAAGDFFSIHYLPTPPNFTTSSVDDTEVVDLPEHGDYYVSRETAIDLAHILGREDAFIASIQGHAGNEAKLYQGMIDRNMSPGPPTERPK